MDKCPKCGAEGVHWEFPYLFYYCGTFKGEGGQQSRECLINQLTTENARLREAGRALRDALEMAPIIMDALPRHWNGRIRALRRS